MTDLPAPLDDAPPRDGRSASGPRRATAAPSVRAVGGNAEDPGRSCVGVEVPPGPAGVDVVMPPLETAVAGSGPGIALLPAIPDRSAAYRSSIVGAVRPGDPVPDEVAVVLATSGSTGDPAGVLLPAAALRAAARDFAHLVGRPEGHRWVAALPLHHAGGLMVAVRSMVAGILPVPMASLGGAAPFTVAAFAEATELAVSRSAGDGRPLAVSLVPAMLATLGAAGPAGLEPLLAYDVVLVGGAAAPGRLVERLRAAGVRLLPSYGMTETCGGVVFDGRPLVGATVAAGSAGRLRVCGEQVALGYRDGRAAQRWSTGPDGRRCFLTGDLGSVGPDGAVQVLGRIDDVVQVGGASVSVAAVASVLRDDPRVAAAEVVALPDDRLGSWLVALVVPAGHGGGGTSPGGDLVGALGDLVQTALGPAARPRRVVVVGSLPMLESGKPDRAALLRMVGPADGR